jgi:ABC-type cobalamin/Fe3+-siderophores transport system ATPase subunit
LSIQIELESVTFAWPAEGDDQPGTNGPGGLDPAAGGGGEAGGATAAGDAIFSELSLELPGGLGFLVGPNGIGKSTLMLLAGGRVFPQAGTVRIRGVDSTAFADAPFEPALEAERNRLVSFVYQNMEFETEEPIGDLFDVVAEGAVDPGRAAAAQAGLITAADLTDRLGARMQELSKGEMQRAIVVMSLLWGSPIIMMDEPLFAVEPRRAEALLEAVRDHCASAGVSVYTSVHDVELARRFADTVVLFDTDRSISVGTAAELLSRESLERAFRAPWDTLYERQHLYRDLLRQSFGDGGA